MAKLDTFKWCTQIQGGGGAMSTTDNVREVIFGNGYRQVASAGFNTTRREYAIVYAGSDYYDVYTFLKNHLLKPFAWTAPDGELGIYRVKSGSLASSPIAPDAHEITCTFTQEFTSMT